MKINVWLLLITLLILGTSKANSQLLVTLVPDSLNCSPGTTITFAGTLQNTGAQELFLNADSLSVVGVGLTLDDTMFFINSPPSLPGGTATGLIDLFTVSADPTTLPGSYTGTFTITGGSDSFAQDDLASVSFTVNVLPESVPEPGAWALLTCGLGGAGLLAIRRRR